MSAHVQYANNRFALFCFGVARSITSAFPRHAACRVFP
jgi:hypothetical protein